MESIPQPPVLGNDIPTTENINPAVSRLPSDMQAVATRILEAGHPAPARCQPPDNRNHRLECFRRAVGKRFCDAKLSNFICDNPKQTAVVAALEAFANEMPERTGRGEGVILYGPSGVGKDHLLIGLGKIAIGRYGLTVCYEYGLDLYAELRDRIGSDASEEEWVRDLVRPDILILSDPIPPKGALSEFQASQIQRVVNKRYLACKPTWCTLNVSCGSEADELLAAPIVDRLRHGALALFCDWPSHRKALA